MHVPASDHPDTGNRGLRVCCRGNPVASDRAADAVDLYVNEQPDEASWPGHEVPFVAETPQVPRDGPGHRTSERLSIEGDDARESRGLFIPDRNVADPELMGACRLHDSVEFRKPRRTQAELLSEVEIRGPDGRT